MYFRSDLDTGDFDSFLLMMAELGLVHQVHIANPAQLMNLADLFWQLTELPLKISTGFGGSHITP